MMIRPNSVFVAALCLALPASAELVDRVAAVVNRDIIALSEVEARAAPELARLSAERDPKRRTELRGQALKSALDQLIGEKLLETELKELNIDVTEQEVDLGIEDVRKQNQLEPEQFEQLLRTEGYTLKSYRTFIRKHLAKLKLINLKVRSKVKIAEEDLKAEYGRFVSAESGDFEVRARNILVATPANATPEAVEKAKQKALQISSEAKKPGSDFAALAKARSDGPNAADGGDLGFFKKGVMLPEFDRAAFSLKPGEVSEPIKTPFGYQILKVEERRAMAVKPFEEVREQIRDRLMRGQLERYTDQYVQELRSAAVVDVKI